MELKKWIAAITIASLMMAVVISVIPGTAKAATGDVKSSCSTLVVFEIDRNDYGRYLSGSEAAGVVDNKIIPALKRARSDYTWFDSEPEWYTNRYSWRTLIIKDLRYHYNVFRWDNDIGYNDWFISRTLWD